MTSSHRFPEEQHAPRHHLLPNPDDYVMTELSFQFNPERFEETSARITVRAKDGSDVRTFRFSRIRFPEERDSGLAQLEGLCAEGVEIVDLRSRQWDGIHVLVNSLWEDHPPLFWADEIELT